MAARVAPGDVQQPHHSVAASPRATAPLEGEPVHAADRLVGGPDAVPVIDDTAPAKQGRHSVGVARRYRGRLGKAANRQAPVSLTPARAEVPVGVALRLFPPEGRAADRARRTKAGVPAGATGRPKWRIAPDEPDRARAAGATFGGVPADAEYGEAAAFRRGSPERGLTWAVAIPPTREVYPADVTVAPAPRQATGRRPEPPVPSAECRSVGALVAAPPEIACRAIAWRRGRRSQGRVRRAAGAGGGRPRRGPRPAPAGRRGSAGGRAPRQRRAQVRPRRPPGRGAAGRARRRDQGPPGVRAGAPAAQGRARAGSSRGPRVGGPAPPRAAVPDRLRLPPAPAAAAPGRKPRPADRGHRRRRPRRRCGATRSRP